MSTWAASFAGTRSPNNSTAQNCRLPPSKAQKQHNLGSSSRRPGRPERNSGSLCPAALDIGIGGPTRSCKPRNSAENCLGTFMRRSKLTIQIAKRKCPLSFQIVNQTTLRRIGTPFFLAFVKTSCHVPPLRRPRVCDCPRLGRLFEWFASRLHGIYRRAVRGYNLERTGPGMEVRLTGLAAIANKDRRIVK